jgi:glycosyltransferase involved in cell wall biosynthesis
LRLLMAGRLKRYKGLELLAETVRLVRKNHALSVRIVGAPQNQRDLEAFREFPSIEFDLGWKSDREFMAHLDWADACVLPYVEASQSGVAPMSFKRGRSVVATPVGGIPEQVCHDVTGLITEDVSATALAASIRRLAEDRDLVRRLGENARSHAETELSWKALAPRFAGVLEAAAHRSRT